MTPSKILYIDRNGVSVTPHTLKIKNHWYPLKEIKRYTPVVVNPKKVSGILALIFGIVLITSGYVNATSSVLISEFESGQLFNTMIMPFYSGAALTILGILTLALTRARYGLQIVTSEGVRNVVVSRKKEYIIRIVHMLNTALTYNDTKHPAIQKINSGMMESANLSLN